MNAGKLGRIGGAALTIALVGCVALVPAAQAGKKAKKAKLVTKTYTKGVGGSLGGLQTTIPDGGGTATQVVRAAIPVKGLNPRGKIVDVNVGVRSTHAQAARCWRSYACRSTRRAARSSWSPTIRPRPPGRTGSSSWPMGGSRGSFRLRPPSRSPSA